MNHISTSFTHYYGYDSDSDDGAIVMKRTPFKMKQPVLRVAKIHNKATENKTMVMLSLPFTTLK